MAASTLAPEINDSEDNRTHKHDFRSHSKSIKPAENRSGKKIKSPVERNEARNGVSPSSRVRQGEEGMGTSSKGKPTRSTDPIAQNLFIPRSTARGTLAPKSPTNPPKKVKFNGAGQSPLDDQLNTELVAASEELDKHDPSFVVIRRSEPKPLTQKDVEGMFEPKFPISRTDAEMELQYRDLKAAAFDFVQKYFLPDPTNPITPLTLVRMAKKMPELMEIINYIACHGERGWVFNFQERKNALVYGVLGKVMQIHFFGQEMFGASDRQLLALRLIDWEMLEDGGFARQKIRASVINGFLSASDRTLPPAFPSSVSRFHVRILALLDPLRTSAPTLKYQTDLRDVLLLGAKFALNMRREPSIIYHFISVMPNNAVDDREMRILNLSEFPSKRAKGGDPLSDDGRIIHVVAWPGILAYRAGSHLDKYGNTPGYRTRSIAKTEIFAAYGCKEHDYPPSPLSRNNNLRDYVSACAHADAAKITAKAKTAAALSAPSILTPPPTVSPPAAMADAFLESLRV